MLIAHCLICQNNIKYWSLAENWCKIQFASAVWRDVDLNTSQTLFKDISTNYINSIITKDIAVESYKSTDDLIHLVNSKSNENKINFESKYTNGSVFEK